MQINPKNNCYRLNSNGLCHYKYFLVYLWKYKRKWQSDLLKTTWLMIVSLGNGFSEAIYPGILLTYYSPWKNKQVRKSSLHNANGRKSILLIHPCRYSVDKELRYSLMTQPISKCCRRFCFNKFQQDFLLLATIQSLRPRQN